MRVALARGLASAFWVATALYALLSAIPFASKHFIEPGLMPPVNAFAGWHAAISLTVLVVTASLLAPWLRERALITLVAAWAVSVVAEIAVGSLSALEPSWVAIATTVAALVPPAWLSRIAVTEPRQREVGSAGDATGPAAGEPVTDLIACFTAAIIVTSAHAVFVSAAAPARDLVMHLIAFSVIFAVLSIVRGVARLTPRPAAVERWLAGAAMAAALTVFIDRVVLSPLSFEGVHGSAIALSFGIAIAMLAGPRGSDARDGIQAATTALVPRWAERSTLTGASWLGVAVTALVLGERAVAPTDWNFAVAKMLAFASWLLALASAVRIAPAMRRACPVSPGTGAGLSFAACLLILGVQQIQARGTAVDGGTHASARLIQDALAPAAIVDRSLYEYLQRNSNIARSVVVAPVNVELAKLSKPGAWRPHVFLFVVDSLRRDYLSAYNPRVTFTPAIRSFAGESVVFERAFTRYGATGLSVPSIWTGGMLLHKQYVTPFAPMNTLSKLLAAEGYREWFSVDPLLEVIAPANERREPLDRVTSVKDYRLCTTIQELRGRLDRLDPGTPTFVYSLPQDLHVSTIAREGAGKIDGANYDGFNGPYASRAARLDECFGQFISELKARGLYDDSLVILTSDHGDSLGEEGRIGHAYTIFPEIVQIPLIVHLPSRWSHEFAADPKAIAFSSDLTPTLYRLLGHEPAAPAPFFGQPLFFRGGGKPPVRQPVEVLASSYGSVYGALLDDARRLYIVDGVSLREYAYDLDGSGGGRKTEVRAADRAVGQRAIRVTVDGIARFFRYPAGIHH